ncbi:MAG: hypothetical protein FWE25_04290 [Lachnospiraceae bacterium]|nr:hypothetical protein [Lachnospiraceae bacterium]
MSIIRKTFENGAGILHLLPTWIPRPFNRPGKRLRLHPDDYFAMGMERGAIVERWFSSVTCAETKGAGKNEGMSYVSTDGTQENKILLKEFVDELKADLIGTELIEKFGTWPMYSKLYDYEMPLFHHIHHGEEASKRVGVKPKFEHYFFPKQYNQYLGTLPVSYFGFDPSVSKEEVLGRLKDYTKKDIRITELSRAFRLELDTGWYTPAGVVHAPGSLCTYEPQWNSDVMAMWENVVNGEVFLYKSLSAYLPEEDKDNLEKVLEVADWEINTAGDYRARYFRRPVTEQKGDGYEQQWICYGNDYIGAKKLEVEPGKSVLIQDDCAYGCLVIQGYGTLGKFDCEAPQMIRFGQVTADEFFVSKERAKAGVNIANHSKYEPLVILKHFGPDGNILPLENA